ncbi:hypothetical protein GCM10010345_33610 [Streptomyces canarius]|uniref:Uncharacterized protein n=1 Tax=Streptomyces canarius TaxID=285453 RepID=A0ABQ3CLZ2_9ACTN|nr:hypothetical protein GCM10010345_33610 [Streptomyces canarius]
MWTSHHLRSSRLRAAQIRAVGVLPAAPPGVPGPASPGGLGRNNRITEHDKVWRTAVVQGDGDTLVPHVDLEGPMPPIP